MKKNITKLNISHVFKIALFVLVSFNFNKAISQTKKNMLEIKGKTTTNTRIPLASTNIVLENTNFGASSDENGNFSFYAPEGEYIIVVSSLGYQPMKKKFIVSSAKSNTINFVLLKSDIQLKNIEVIGRKSKSYKNDITSSATKTATKTKDIPQAVTYVTKEVFADQQAYRMNDIIKNVSGVNLFSWYDDFSMRGFRSGETYINGLRFLGMFGPQPLLVNIERVEVLKGPASAMFGNASPGGTMNRISKKPLAENKKSINFTTGSFNTLRATLDFTGPLNKSKTLLYRLNVAHENSGSFRPLQDKKALFIAPSISFKPTDKTTINFDLVVQRFDGTVDRGQAIYGKTAGLKLDDAKNTPVSLSLGTTTDYHTSDMNYFTLALNHKFTDKISFNSSYLRSTNKEDIVEHRSSGYALDANGDEIPSLMDMRISGRQQKQFTDNISSYFVFKTKTGAINHKILLGLDYAQKVRPLGGSRVYSGISEYIKLDGTTGKFKAANIADFKLDKKGNPVPNIPHFDLDNPNYNYGNMENYTLRKKGYPATRYYTTGYYLQDQMTFNKLQVLLGVRLNSYFDYEKYDLDKEKEIKQQKFIPRLGLVYSVTDNINAYGTYTESFEPQRANRMADDVGGPFDPLEGQMIEFGVKSEFFNKRLATNLAVYDITQKNELVDDPNDAGDKLIQTGETNSKGFELDVMGAISDNFSVTANYAYNEAIYVSIPADTDFEKGEVLPNSPKHQGGVFGKYKITKGVLNGVSFNLGTNFVSERNTQSGPKLRLPSYTVMDCGMTYEVDKFVVKATVNNFFNKIHWVGGYDRFRLFPGTPRNYLLSLGYNF